MVKSWWGVKPYLSSILLICAVPSAAVTLLRVLERCPLGTAAAGSRGSESGSPTAAQPVGEPAATQCADLQTQLQLSRSWGLKTLLTLARTRWVA